MSHRRPAWAALVATCLLASLGVCACGSDGDPEAQYAPGSSGSRPVEMTCTQPEPELPSSPLFADTGILEDVDYWACPRPRESDGLFDVDEVTGTQATVTGSTAEFGLDWYGPEQELIAGRNLLFWVGGGGDTHVVNGMVTHSTGGRGYYRWVIPDEANPLDIIFNMDPDGMGDDYTLNFAVDETIGDPLEPRIGTIGHSTLHLVEVGSGDVQVNLNWNTLVDLDLWVTDPTGFRVFYGALMAPSGGNLDLDSYPACNFANDRGRGNENTFWPVGSAPAGQYLVQVDMYDNCGTYAQNVPTIYRVTVVHGDQIEVVNGRFDTQAPEGDPNSAANRTHDISTFTF